MDVFTFNKERHVPPAAVEADREQSLALQVAQQSVPCAPPQAERHEGVRPPARRPSSPSPTGRFLPRSEPAPRAGSRIWCRWLGARVAPAPARQRSWTRLRKTGRHPARVLRGTAARRRPSRARTGLDAPAPSLMPLLTERKFRRTSARRRDTPASRQRAVSAQARQPFSCVLFLLPVSRRQRPLGPMSRRALRRLRGEQRGQEPLGPGALQFVLHDDDDAEEEGPKRGPGGRRPRSAGKEGVCVNNRFELVRNGAALGGGGGRGRWEGACP